MLRGCCEDTQAGRAQLCMPERFPGASSPARHIAAATASTTPAAIPTAQPPKTTVDHLPLPALSLSPRRKVTGRDGKYLGISEKAHYPRLSAMGFARRSRVSMCVGLFVALATIASCGADEYAEVRTPAIGRGDWHEILWVVWRCGSDEGACCYVPYGDTDIIWLHVSLS